MKVGSAGTGRYHIAAEINMIPLIDVSLVLLIIFMVISPILVQSQLRVNIPKVTSASPSEDAALKIEIAADGAMALQGKTVNRGDLRNAMGRLIPPGSKASLLIQADKDVPFDAVVFVMDLAKQLKVEKMGVAVLPKQS